MATPWENASRSSAPARSDVAARFTMCLASASTAGGPAAIFSASARVVVSSSATGTTRLTSPMRAASAASMISAVKISSLARARPTTRESSQVPPPSGTSPIFQNSSPNFARSEATIRSQQSARFEPAPTA